MKKRKTLPKTEDWHKEYYKVLIVKYGYNKPAIQHINGIFLDMLNTQDTPKTRDALRQRMQSVNPNSPKCPPEFKAEIDAVCAHRSEVLAIQQIQRRARRRDKIEALLERVETSVLTSDPETLTVRDYVLLIEAERKLDEYEAKLHGLFPKETIENEPTKNIGNKLANATRLLEETIGTENDDPQEKREGASE